MNNDGTAPSSIPLYRRLWVVVVLTCLGITFPVALLFLVTGPVYRKDGDQLVPLTARSRHIYAGLLGLWLAAIAARETYLRVTEPQQAPGQPVVASSTPTAPATTPSPATPAAAPAQAFTGGKYTSATKGLSADITVAQNGADWTVDVSGARTDGGPAPDCTIRASGTKSGNRISGFLVPFKTDDAEMDAETLGPDKRRLVLTITDGGATLDVAEIGDLCGNHNDLTGAYKLAAPTKGQ